MKVNLKQLKIIIEKDQDKEFKQLFKEFLSFDLIVLRIAAADKRILNLTTNNQVSSLSTYTSHYDSFQRSQVPDEPQEDERLVHYIANHLAIKILKFVMKIKPDTRVLKDLSSGSNLIHTCLATEIETCNIKIKCDILNFLVTEIKVQFSQDKEGNTEFHKWLHHPCVKCLNLLINHCCTSKNQSYYSLRNSQGMTPLHLSIQEKNYEAFCNLYKYVKYDMNQVTSDKSTLIHLCAVSGSLKIMNELFEIKSYDFDVNKINLAGQSPFNLACSNENYAVAKLLLMKGAKVNKNDLTILNNVNI